MTQSLSDIFAEEEARRLAETRVEEAAEKAAWGALTPEQQQAEIDRRAAKYAALDNLPDEDDCDDEDEEQEDDE